MKIYPLLTDKESPSAIILANGDYPTHPLPATLLAQGEYIVCCDGATNEFILNGRIPDAIVGDGDSLSEENRRRFSSIIHSCADQETNDLTKAISFCIKRNKSDIFILGATGKREDHTLGNISLLAEYMDLVSVQMITDYGVFTPIDTDSGFECHSGQQISIFALEPKEISTENLRYPIRNRILSNWWEGTLNEASNDNFIIRTNGKVVVFRAFK